MARQGQPGDGFTLVTLSATPQPVIEEIAFDVADVVREIDALAVTHQAADLQVTFEQINRVIDDAVKSS